MINITLKMYRSKIFQRGILYQNTSLKFILIIQLQNGGHRCKKGGGVYGPNANKRFEQKNKHRIRVQRVQIGQKNTPFSIFLPTFNMRKIEEDIGGQDGRICL